MATVENPKLHLSSQGDTLNVVFPYEFGPRDVFEMEKTIRTKLERIDKRAKHLKFNLHNIHPVHNALGRALDLADAFSHKSSVGVMLRKEDISELTQIPDYHALRSNEKLPTKRGLYIWPIKTERNPKQDEVYQLILGGIPTQSQSLSGQTVILECNGKVTCASDSEVTAVLFTKSQEVYAAFRRCQFPTPDIYPGLMFSYKAFVKIPGTTTVEIRPLVRQYPSKEAYRKILQEVRQSLSGVDLDDI